MDKQQPSTVQWSPLGRPASAREAATLGEHLITMKQQLGHGNFGSYLRTLGLSADSAGRYMRLARYAAVHPEVLMFGLARACRLARLHNEHSPAQPRLAVQHRFRERDVVATLVTDLRRANVPVAREVKCAAGVADVVTPDAVYEVELLLSRDVLFHALGQVLLYRAALDHGKRAVIVGLHDPSSPVTALLPFVQQLGVEVMFYKPGAEGQLIRASASTQEALVVLREAARAVESLHDLAPGLNSTTGRKLLSEMKQAVQELEEHLP